MTRARGKVSAIENPAETLAAVRALRQRRVIGFALCMLTPLLLVGCGGGGGVHASNGSTVKLTRCYLDGGDQYAVVDVSGATPYTAAVDFYAANGQFEDRSTATAISSGFNPATAPGGPLVDGTTFTCHLAEVDAGDTKIYVDQNGGQIPNSGYGPVPSGINLSGK
jgi:hypothetical protein